MQERCEGEEIVRAQGECFQRVWGGGGGVNLLVFGVFC